MFTKSGIFIFYIIGHWCSLGSPLIVSQFSVYRLLQFIILYLFTCYTVWRFTLTASRTFWIQLSNTELSFCQFTLTFRLDGYYFMKIKLLIFKRRIWEHFVLLVLKFRLAVKYFYLLRIYLKVLLFINLAKFWIVLTFDIQIFIVMDHTLWVI